MPSESACPASSGGGRPSGKPVFAVVSLVFDSSRPNYLRESWFAPEMAIIRSICSVATARLDSASAWSPRLFQIGKTEPRLMAGLRLNHGLTSQNGYEELSYKYGKILIWASSNNTLDIQNFGYYTQSLDSVIESCDSDDTFAYIQVLPPSVVLSHRLR